MIIVLDPGHGSSEYEGASYNGYIEKDIDLAVAKVLKDRLEKYDGVTVYLTRDTDVSVGLKERCDFAKTVNADYFFSIHFNSSSSHILYGSEIWLSSKSKFYNKIYPVANELINGFHQLGLSDRGIKTKLGKDNQDYYAVIKYSTQYNIPSCIIEHCYLDNNKDTVFLSRDSAMTYANSLTAFGISDADAIARGLKLKSTFLGVDYSSNKVCASNKKGIVKPDVTAPDTVNVSLVSYSKNNSSVSFNIHAKDADGYIQYYQYSLDGGRTFSDLLLWPKKSPNEAYEDCVVSANIKTDNALDIVAIVHNGYDISNVSNVLHIEKGLYSLKASKTLLTGTVVRDIERSDNISSFGMVISEGLILGITFYICLKKYLMIKIKHK